ncbi:MAG TPA: protein kinase, partial [Gemmatimonadaceae bacterium]|nr:protein kinase [Gemmatimonadaceae bacterium]
ALERALERRVAVKVLPEHLAASVSVERFKREILLSAGLQHPHIVGVLSAGDAGGLPFFVMPFVEGESLADCIARSGPVSVRRAVSILKDVARALTYAHARGVVHRDIKPHNILLAGGAATVTDFGVAKAITSARRSGAHGGTLTSAGTSLGTPLYMAPEQAAADPDVDHRADIYALGITAYEMLTGAAPFAGLAPRALLTARMSEDPPRLDMVRADVPSALSDLVMRCLARDPADRPQSAEELLGALDDPAMVSGVYHAPPAPRGMRRMLHGWRLAAAALLVAAVGIASAAVALRHPSESIALAPAAVAAPSPASVVVLPLVSIGADSGNAYLADGITNELAAALARVPGVRVVSPSRAAAMLKSGKSPNEVGKALNVAQQLEGTVQRDGKRLRVTARLVGVSDGIMHWSDMYERDATDMLTVQEEIAREITGAVGSTIGTEVADANAAAAPTPSSDAEGKAYDLYLRGRFQLGRRSGASVKKAITYFEQAIEKDPSLAMAHSGLADALGLLPLYTDAAAEPSLASALRSADRAIALDSTLAEAYASRGVLHGRTWRWSEAERDFRRAIALNPSYAPAHQWLGELFVVTGRYPEATRSLERAAQLDPSSPVIAGSLALALGLSGRSAEAIATAERAVSYDSALIVTRFMLGATRLYARQPAAAVAPLEAAVQIDPSSRTVLGLLGFAYGASGNVDAAQRMRARIESMPTVPGTDVALARIALSLGDTNEALQRLERAARARDPFFATESATSPVFDALRTSPRYAALLRSVGITPFRMVALR